MINRDGAITNPANILVGVASTNGGTIITIPAGRVWKGKISLNAALTVAGGGAAVASRATVSVAGATATPAAGVIFGVYVAAPSQSAVAANTGGIAMSARDETELIIAAGTSAATLTLQINSASAASATAAGQLVG